MSPGPEIALAASARDWPDRVHRFLLDHGGGRVRSRVMGPEQALSDQYEVLFIDDVCSFLTPRLIRSLRDLNREIVGVYSPADGPDAKRHLLECGITDVIESDASAEEFLAVGTGTLLHRRPILMEVSRGQGAFRVGVFGQLGGVGVTEVAIGVAFGVSRFRPTVLIDLDTQSPSLAHRLDLPLHPNLLTAIDKAHHSGQVEESLIDCDQLAVVGGLAHPNGQDIPPVELEALLDALAAFGYEMIVADLGAPSFDRLDSIRFNALIAVGVGSPVGLSRLVRTVQAVASRAGASDLVAVVNRAGSGRRRSEIRSEMAQLVPDVPVVILPEDRRLDRAAWDGVRVRRGPFARSVERIAALIESATS